VQLRPARAALVSILQSSRSGRMVEDCAMTERLLPQNDLRPPPTTPGATRPPAEGWVDDRAFSWYADGVISGVFGASVVALFFLVVDLLAGRPLFTPNALGTSLFLGQAAAPDAPIVPAIVAGYTAVHGTIFVGFGVIAAFEVLSLRRIPPTDAGTLLLTALLFVAFEVSFLSMAALFAPHLMAVLGVGRVAIANAIAALAMARYLLSRLRA
jgi:hypothetical protein